MTEAEITELRVVVDEVRMAGIVAGSGGDIACDREWELTGVRRARGDAGTSSPSSSFVVSIRIFCGASLRGL
ncbi:hypothetical protein AGMMS49950_03850 [Endomicrobiia bacterium]|nr:hypothetical protein AGMMS49531_04380 [Endomicrobiia bacterium]GHT69968.1 hypothetical protein AGMMS49950_03850 [Endomicrobiia bacterium]